MKLAETYYRQQDFPNAQTQFQILAQENPRAGFTEKALFFAAKSAMQSMGAQSLDRALVLLDEVVKKNGELKWAARNEQAVIERKLGKSQDAATLYDEVLQGAARPEEKREALCGKGDILYESGPAERENYKRAIEAYDQLATQKGRSAALAQSSALQKGHLSRKIGRSGQRARDFLQNHRGGNPAGSATRIFLVLQSRLQRGPAPRGRFEVAACRCRLPKTRFSGRGTQR